MGAGDGDHADRGQAFDERVAEVLGDGGIGIENFAIDIERIVRPVDQLKAIDRTNARGFDRDLECVLIKRTLQRGGCANE